MRAPILIGLALLAVLLTVSGFARSAPGTQSERIFFESSRTPEGLYSMAPDGSDVRPVPHGENGSNAKLSPDGTKVAFTAYIDGNVDIYTTDGNTLTRVTTDPDFDGYADWSPNGTRIAFVRADGIYVMNADGSEVTFLHSGYGPSWAPDGSRIAFTENSTIYSMLPDGTGVERLTSDPDVEFSPSWSPDGRYLAFARNIPGPWWQYITIWVRDMTTGQEWEVYGAPPPNGSGSPRWSPDGTRIVFYSYQDGNSDLWTVSRDGVGAARVTVDPADDDYPDWGLASLAGPPPPPPPPAPPPPPPPAPPPPPPPPPPFKPPCTVPRAVGMRLRNARTRIGRGHCRVGAVRRARAPRRLAGRVLRQSPRPGAVRAAGSRVALVVGR